MGACVGVTGCSRSLGCSTWLSGFPDLGWIADIVLVHGPRDTRGNHGSEHSKTSRGKERLPRLVCFSVQDNVAGMRRRSGRESRRSCKGRKGDKGGKFHFMNSDLCKNSAQYSEREIVSNKWSLETQTLGPKSSAHHSLQWFCSIYGFLSTDNHHNSHTYLLNKNLL